MRSAIGLMGLVVVGAVCLQGFAAGATGAAKARPDARVELAAPQGAVHKAHKRRHARHSHRRRHHGHRHHRHHRDWRHRHHKRRHHRRSPRIYFWTGPWGPGAVAAPLDGGGYLRLRIRRRNGRGNR